MVGQVVRLLLHETERVFSDVLVSAADQTTYQQLVRDIASRFLQSSAKVRARPSPPGISGTQASETR